MPDKDLYCTVRIDFADRPDSILSSTVQDKLQILCGDFSEERLIACQKEVCRKLKAAWEYLATARRNPADE